MSSHVYAPDPTTLDTCSRWPVDGPEADAMIEAARIMSAYGGMSPQSTYWAQRHPDTGRQFGPVSRERNRAIKDWFRIDL